MRIVEGLLFVGALLIAAFVLFHFLTKEEPGVVPSSCLGVMCRDPNDIRVERDGACHCARPVVCL